MDDIAEQFAIRDRFLRHRQMLMTHEQRMQEMLRLQQQARTILGSSPEGYARFRARNIKQRATDVTDNNAT